MAEADPSPGRKEWLLGALLVLATAAAYQQVWHAGFIWDDDRHLTQNPCIIGPLGLREIWTTGAARICPLVLTTFWFEHAAWGLNPLPYHIVNVLLHAACGIMLWRVLRGLGIPGAWFGAALWTLHPVQVETVAWITELKNTQSCLFYLLAIFFYLRWMKRGGEEPSLLRGNYLLATLCCLLAMASKSSTVVLPVVLGLCAWWRNGRWRWRMAIGLIPIALMSAATSALSLWTQNLEGANETQWALSWPGRIAVAGRVFWFYLGKLLWPHPLVFIYPRWSIDTAQVAAYLPVLALGALLWVAWRGRKGRLRPISFTTAYFLVALLPVLGLVQQFFTRYSFVGDHFQYLASMGPLALIAAAAAAASGTDAAALPGTLARGCVLLVLGTLTWRQCAEYSDVRTLWLATNSRNPDSWLVHNNLGILYAQEGSLDEAIGEYGRAGEINPRFSGTYSNLGIALLKKGRLDDAIVQFGKALEIEPVDPETHNNLGNAYRRKGWMDQAVGQFNAALKIDPEDASARFNLGNALQRMGRLDEAVAQFRKTLEIDPRHPGARFSLGNALAQGGHMKEAVREFEKALSDDPRNPRIHTNLGAVLLNLGRTDDAIAQFRAAVESGPGDVDAHVNLGQVLLQAGRPQEAIAEYRKALEMKPDDPEINRLLSAALESKRARDSGTR
jgi:tetratricopeptide (TPR) repeat protein